MRSSSCSSGVRCIWGSDVTALLGGGQAQKIGAPNQGAHAAPAKGPMERHLADAPFGARRRHRFHWIFKSLAAQVGGFCMKRRRARVYRVVNVAGTSGSSTGFSSGSKGLRERASPARRRRPYRESTSFQVLMPVADAARGRVIRCGQVTIACFLSSGAGPPLGAVRSPSPTSRRRAGEL